jgi:hypothetical protein
LKVLVKYPTRSRPKLFQERLTQYLYDPTVHVLVTADLDDASMNNPEMKAWIRQQPRTSVRYGMCKSKVEACNDGVAEDPWDGLLILASDDMVPQRGDYARRIAQIYDEFFPDGDGVLHLNDGRTQRTLNTLCILDRKYFDRFGFIYNPAYTSTHCDDEFQAVSERLGRAVYVDEVVIHHDWIGAYAPDSLHQRNESYFWQDERTFKARRAAGFPN